MTQLKWEDFVVEVKRALWSNKMVFMGCHTEDWFNFVGRAIQLSGYYAHVFRVVDITDKGDITTIEADGKFVRWHSFFEYQNKVKSGSEQLTMATIECSAEQLRDSTIEARSQIGHKYDMGQNVWHGITTIMSWFGNFGKVVSGQLDKINPMSEDNEFNCSESCTRQVRYSGLNYWGTDQSQATTPTEFIHPIEITKEFQTMKG